MIYKIINSEKIRIQRAILSCLLIITTLITFSGCMTTEMFYISPESVNYGNQGEITKIQLKNGTSIDCENKTIKFERDSNSVGYIVIVTHSADTVKKGNKLYIQSKEQRITASDILKIHLKKTDVNGGLTALAIVGGLIAVILIIGAISLSGADEIKIPIPVPR